jgi:hypothetical protein
MDYPPNNRAPPPPQMHHQIPMHHPQHPLLSNQLQPINPDTHTSMWLDDPYAISNASASQRDSGFNSRPASLRSIESTVTSTTGPPLHHGPTVPAGYEPIPPPQMPDHENIHPHYVEMQSASIPPQRLDSNQYIPELLNLLMEDDTVIVCEAIQLIQTLIKQGGEGRSEVIRNRDVSFKMKFLLYSFDSLF